MYKKNKNKNIGYEIHIGKHRLFKYSLHLLLCFVMIVSLVACASSKEDISATTDTSAESSTDVSTGSGGSSSISTDEDSTEETEISNSSQVASDSDVDSSEGMRTVTDLTGTEVEIPTSVNRVCTSFPAIDEVLLLLDSASKDVAIAKSNTTNEWYLKLNPEAADLPVVFDSTSDVNVEALMALDPDVVFVSSESMRDQLIDLGIPALYVVFTSPDTLIQGIELIADVMGGDASEIGQELIADYQKNMDTVTSITDSIDDENRPRVFYAAGSTLDTEGQGSIVTDWIEMGGGINVAAENGIEGTFVDISLEQLLAFDPDVIICRDAEYLEEYMTDSRFAGLSAVKSQRVYINPKGVFVWCVRGADEVLQPLWAAKVIQPDLFEDLDVRDYVEDFYETYYHYSLDDQEMDSIMNPTA